MINPNSPTSSLQGAAFASQGSPEATPDAGAPAARRTASASRDARVLGSSGLGTLSAEPFDLECLTVPEPQQHAGGYGTASTGGGIRRR
jgi:hypothetical protein